MESKNIEERFDWRICGHQNIIQYLQKSIATGNIFRSYIFYGPTSVGKRHTANLFARSLVCERYVEGKRGHLPCDDCQSCLEFQKGIHPDIHILDSTQDKQIGIDQIRQIQHVLSLRSFLDRYKIIIIDRAERLTLEAHNAFLKTLEEPNPRSIIILIAQSISNFPKTVLSRCQLLSFNPVAKEEVKKWLSYMFPKSNKLVKSAIHLGSGKPGLALALLQNPLLLDEYRAKTEKILKIFTTKTFQEKLNITYELIKKEKGEDEQRSYQEYLGLCQLLMRDLLLQKTNNEQFIRHLFLKKNLHEVSNQYTLLEIKNILDYLEQSRQVLTKYINPKLIIENFLLRL